MKQLGLSIPLFIKKPKVTRRQKFLEEMEQVIPWAEWTNRIAPHYPVAGLGRKPFELEAMLRIHMMQQWFGYSDPGMEEALHDVPKRRFSSFATCWRSITWHKACLLKRLRS